ncbi:MAG: hypothetical protein HOV87_13475 [Catenulispora sp.]|nr:hypothetical protein [Catenulispora sp.]
MLKLFSPLPGRARRAVAGLAIAVSAVLGVAAPATAAPHAHVSDTVDITAVEPLTYTIDTHGTLAAGVVHLVFKNAGQAPHQAQLFRLNDGVTFERWQADLHSANPNTALFTDAVPAGGATPVLPGARQDVWDVLQGGTYVVACFVPGPDGTPHIFLGMYKPFDVVGSTGLVSACGRPACPWIQAHDLTYTMPASLVRGTVVRFDDTDAKDVHEVNFGKLLPGKTVDDAKAWFVASAAQPPVNPGPPPFTFAGGHGAEPPGQGGWFQVEADPGQYIAFCLVPDDQTGKPHAAMGMVVGFTII